MKLAILLAIPLLAQETFHYEVMRVRLPRDEPGTLDISGSGLVYHGKKKQLSVALQDIRLADLSNPRQIRIELYDRVPYRAGDNREYTFRLRNATHDAALARFLSARLARPMLAAHTIDAPPQFEIPAYHRRALGGEHGTLVFTQQGITFAATKPTASRSWLWPDISSIGSASDYSFRISTLAEIFTLDLKQRLPRDAWNLAWHRVNQLP